VEGSIPNDNVHNSSALKRVVIAYGHGLDVIIFYSSILFYFLVFKWNS